MTHLPDWLKTAAIGAGLVLSHAYTYLRDHRADVARLLLKRSNAMSALTPVVDAVGTALPALIRGTKAVAKVLLDEVYTTGTPEEKAAALTTQLEPGFNKAMADLGLPWWATEMVDGVFARLVAVVVKEVEAA